MLWHFSKKNISGTCATLFLAGSNAQKGLFSILLIFAHSSCAEINGKWKLMNPRYKNNETMKIFLILHFLV